MRPVASGRCKNGVYEINPDRLSAHTGGLLCDFVHFRVAAENKLYVGLACFACDSVFSVVVFIEAMSSGGL